MSAHHGLVLHVQVGNGDCYGEFSNPNNQASSTWWVSKSGLIVQYVDSDYAAWTEAAGNFTWDSVETEGLPSEPLTDAQIASLGLIYAWGMETYGWPNQLAETPSGTGLGWHGMGGVAWGNHPNCPGDIRKAQRQAVLNAAHPAPTPTPSPPPNDLLEDFTVNCTDPTTGGTWILDPSDGHIEAILGADHHGALNYGGPASDPGNRYNWKGTGNLVGITPVKAADGTWGYAIICRHFAPFNGSWYFLYTFPRNNSAK